MALIEIDAEADAIDAKRMANKNTIIFLNFNPPVDQYKKKMRLCYNSQ